MLTESLSLTRRLTEVLMLFLRFGVTAFGGPAAHVALMQRECVERRQWISREAFLDVLAVSSLIPGPTSTELAMHIGRLRAGWPGLIVAGVAFIAPAAVIVGVLAAIYVRTGEVAVTRELMEAVQPVAVLLVVQAMVPLGRSALRSPVAVVIAAGAAAAVLAGVSEIAALLLAGLAGLVGLRSGLMLGLLATLGVTAMAAETAARAVAPMADVVRYFLTVGSLLFGSGYVLFPVLQGDLVERLGWLTNRELLDAVAVGQSTPGPVFTTATFIGYLLGGPMMAMAATVSMFAPAFVFSAISSVVLERLKESRAVRGFLDGVNAAAVALIAVVVVTLGRSAFDGAMPVVVGAVAAVALFVARWSPTTVLMAAAVAGAAYGWFEPRVR